MAPWTVRYVRIPEERGAGCVAASGGLEDCHRTTISRNIPIRRTRTEMIVVTSALQIIEFPDRIAQLAICLLLSCCMIGCGSCTHNEAPMTNATPVQVDVHETVVGDDVDLEYS